jgi:PLP dependent protein
MAQYLNQVQFIMNEIENNILNIKKNIIKAELNSSRKENSVILMAVSKTQSVEKIKHAYNAGQKDFGENYLQEAVKKILELKNFDIIWHYIGKIQGNKAKLIADNFDWVHSADKISTLIKIDNYRNKLEKNLNVCIQVNIDNEESKSGIEIKNIEEFLESTHNLQNINIRGLMAIPQYQESFEDQFNTFKRLQDLFNNLVKKGYKLDTLSIGMSSDYHAAIEAGSTIIRIGTAIFGERIK